MAYTVPQQVSLTEPELKLYARIKAGKPIDLEHWHDAADAMEELVESLLKREAIPPIRLRLFDDADLAETNGKSPLDEFQSEGNDFRSTIRHGHFVKYLHHFIYGPSLPKAAIEGLCKILNDDMGTSGTLIDQYCKHARDCVRKYGLQRHEAGTEFFRLGVEIGMEVDAARTLRKAARSVR